VSGLPGIFLDRGELELLVGAEQRYHQQMAPPVYRGDSAPPYRGGQGGYKDSAPPYGYGRGHGDSPPPYGHSGPKRKRRSFLEDLFD